VPVQVTGVGSLMNIHFARHPIRRPADAMKGNIEARNLLHLEMIHRGYYIARRGFVALSLPITETDTNGLVAAFGEFLDEHGAAIVAETRSPGV